MFEIIKLLAVQQLETKITDPLAGKNLTSLIASVVEYALDLVGIIAVAMLVYGGFLYITSAGDETKAKQATATLTYAVIGIVVVFSAVVIIRSIKSAIGL